MVFVITDRREKGAPIRRLRRTSFLGALHFFCSSWFPASAATAPSDPVRDAAEHAIKTLDLQVSLPHTPTDLDLLPHWYPHIPAQLLYALAAAAVVVVVYILMDMVPGWRSRDDEGWGTTGDGFLDTAVASEISLAQADELAARGLFVEAIHLLLLHSLAEIRRRLRLDFADSLTSREILRRARLPESVTNALRSIVTRVELSYFGGYPATRPDYDSCRAGFEALSSVLASSPPPAAAEATR